MGTRLSSAREHKIAAHITGVLYLFYANGQQARCGILRQLQALNKALNTIDYRIFSKRNFRNDPKSERFI